MKRIISMILLCVVLLTCLSGCRQKAKFEKGFGYTSKPTYSKLGARSDTDTFAIDDVTFDLYFGTYHIDHYEKYNTDPKSFYGRTALLGRRIIFGLYICNSKNHLSTANDMELPDYRTIDTYYFVKEIPEGEAFSEEYGIRMSRWKGVTYNHCEELTIPMEIFTDESGRFRIKLIAFLEPINKGENYYITMVSYIEFGYEMLDEDTIKIMF